MKNIHLVPTDKESRLIIYSTLLNELLLLDEAIKDWKHKRHIYITNDEEIKVDWFITNNNEIFKCIKNKEEQCFYNSNASILTKFCKKIILTTDPDLIKDGVQSIDDDFLEWFVKNPSCDEVEVEKNECNYDEYRRYFNYKPIIPKQETLEEFISKTDTPDGLDQFSYDKGLEDGAKWQAERMYSEEEVRDILIKYVKTNPTKPYRVLSWFEQFKKK